MTNTKPLRIIIIDDDPAINLLLKTALSKAGHIILTYPAPNACALPLNDTSSCQQGFPCADVIITDIVMPKMSGIEFFERLREKGCKTQETNKAFMSATTRDEHFDAIDKLGYKLFVKPFKLVEIFDWIEECAKRDPVDQLLVESG